MTNARLFGKVLVPHDFSDHADRALRLAANLVGAHGKLIVLHVVPEFLNVAAQEGIVKRAREQLEAVVARGVPKGLEVDARVKIGDPYRSISEVAREADSIVMCTRGMTGLRHLVIGSVAEKVVRHAPVPVLTFRPE
jgi:nucleotide-binding universal stress UspA family protein